MSNDYTRKAIVEFLNESPSIAGKTVLDFGCGDGWGSLELFKHGALVTAFDTDVNAGGLLGDSRIKIFRDKASVLSRNFDIVFCHHVLEHIYNPLEFLRDLREMMRDDSELWLSVPNFAVNYTYCEGHIMPYNMPVLIEHLRMAGFDVANGSYRVTDLSHGHLRVRIKKYNGAGTSAYPEPMKTAMKKWQRVESSILKLVNW